MTLRSDVLLALKEKQGEWVSGESLSESFQVSRTAVWKQVKKLASEGYEIESSPRKGYRINHAADLLSPEEVCPGLRTRVFGQQHYIYFRETDSTNKQARLLASQGYPEGTAVVAEMQTEGRGRRGRSWFSPASQGIYMSLILRPALPLKEISRVSLVAALAAAETLQEDLGLPARIKWPNDVLVNDRKIAGILSEAVTDMDSVEYIVTGIGININNSGNEFPNDFRTLATSAYAEDGCRGSRVKVLQGLWMRFEQYYRQLLEGHFADTLERLKSMSNVIGQQVKLDAVNGMLTGRAVDIDENGCLLVRDELGTIHAVMSGEISLLKDQ